MLELAIGWKEGLLILATRWTYTLTPAIELAVKKKDVESLDILCNKFNAPLFSDDDEFRSYILSLLSYEEACILLVKALKRRRDALAGLARRYLSSYDLSQLGIKDGRTLDVTARPVFDLLSKRAIPLDPWLFPGPKSSIYYTLSAVWTLGNMSGCFGMTFALDELFTSNFRDFDYPNDSSSPYWSPNTPLHAFLQYAQERYETWVIPCIWLLDKGALPTMGQDEPKHNLLVRVAQSLANLSEDIFAAQVGMPSIRALLQYASGLYSSTQEDKCVCFCSANGCLPLHHLLRQPSLKFCRGCHGHTQHRTYFWAFQCQDVPDDELAVANLETSVRLELFNRLGMAHTCCSSGRLWVDEEENVRLRDEDEELAEQLEVLMDVYRHTLAQWVHEEREVADELFIVCSCRNIEGNRWTIPVEGALMAHQQWWWSKVGQILPDDSSKVCDDGMAFLDVIQHHFQVKIVDLPEQFNSGDTVVDSSLHNEANTLADGGTGPGTERPRNSLSESKGVFVPQKRPELLKDALLNWQRHSMHVVQDETWPSRVGWTTKWGNVTYDVDTWKKIRWRS